MNNTLADIYNTCNNFLFYFWFCVFVSLYGPAWSGTFSVGQDGLKLMVILLPLPPECRDSLPHLALFSILLFSCNFL